MSDERYVDGPPAGASGWLEVWRENRRYRTAGGLQSLLQKIFRRGSAADLDRQRDFNLVLLDLLNDIRAEIGTARDDARADVKTLQADVQKGDEALASDLARVIPIASKRNDALVAALDQKIEAVAARLRDLTNPAQVPAPGQARAPVLHNRLPLPASRRWLCAAARKKSAKHSSLTSRTRATISRCSTSAAAAASFWRCAARPASRRAASTRTSARSPT